ncbi:hypothetical protein Pmar_PMAR024609 [Perkinsus marinus ATCC 50983]|uniref:Uncharacterized protein n=1 Tax=Perkinsus marinus (strain ATCC 50983 / TXsc) TaxID=423536 RepID=C5LJ20_PERM5|nr:hypothetical protein Pmar_PMAR024609 [Perkinsus marinus ATCC 50983]EER03273.1 hypothetical protein Pmar_PMAR024609 [Perkinsus marinus ATCC 50983]|eukprot:XP_002771457.1 hypothetical protein Pmar_PMAR024609 [Perkinsus marinus ATCC 50983]
MKGASSRLGTGLRTASVTEVAVGAKFWSARRVLWAAANAAKLTAEGEDAPWMAVPPLPAQAPCSCAKSMVARSPGEQVGKVCTLTLAVQDEKGDMNIWKVEKAEEKAVLDALGDDFVLLDIPV